MLTISKGINSRFKVEGVGISIENVDYERLYRWLKGLGIPEAELDTADWLMKHTRQTVEFDSAYKLKNIVVKQ